MYFDRIDKRQVRFRVHWFLHHMKTTLVSEWLRNYGTDIHLVETTEYEGISLKTGTLSGTMKCTETQFLSIPYRGRVYNREVLITVQGRQSLFLRCNKYGHHRATCPESEEKTNVCQDGKLRTQRNREYSTPSVPTAPESNDPPRKASAREGGDGKWAPARQARVVADSDIIEEMDSTETRTREGW